MLRHNSLLRIKEEICEGCGQLKPIKSRHLCQNCYDYRAKLKYAARYSEVKEDEEDEESVALLKKDADLLFSRLIRLRAAEAVTGLLNCFICGKQIHYTDAHAMHFVVREDSITRLHPKNVRAGCFECNVTKGGNLIEYRKKLDQEENLLSDWLEAQARGPEKFWRQELKQLIADYSKEIAQLKKLKQLK